MSPASTASATIDHAASSAPIPPPSSEVISGCCMEAIPPVPAADIASCETLDRRRPSTPGPGILPCPADGTGSVTSSHTSSRTIAKSTSDLPFPRLPKDTCRPVPGCPIGPLDSSADATKCKGLRVAPARQGRRLRGAGGSAARQDGTPDRRPPHLFRTP